MAQQAVIIPYSWEVLDFQPRYPDEETGEITWGNKHCRVFIWGHDASNDPVVWIVEDYKPYCLIKIEDVLENEDEWCAAILDALHNNLKDYIKEKASEPSKSYLKSLSISTRSFMVSKSWTGDRCFTGTPGKIEFTSSIFT